MSGLPSARSFVIWGVPLRDLLIFANCLPAEPKFSHSSSTGEAAEAQGLAPWEVLSPSLGALAMLLCQWCLNSCSVYSQPALDPTRSWGRDEMGVIPCSWSWRQVCLKRPLPSCFCLPSLSLPNRIEIKPVSVFIKIIFPLNWRFDFVNMEISRHSGHTIIVTLASTICSTQTHCSAKRAVMVPRRLGPLGRVPLRY